MEECSFIVALVDDTDLIRACLKQLLRLNGIQIAFEASNGQECIEKMEQSAQHPDIIVLDIEMPVMDGFQAAVVLKQKWPSTKIIAFSSLNDQNSIDQMLDAGADHFLSKDNSPSSLLKLIKSGFDNCQ